MSTTPVPELLRAYIALYRAPAEQPERLRYGLDDSSRCHIGKALGDIHNLEQEGMMLPGLKERLQEAAENSPFCPRAWIAEALQELAMDLVCGAVKITPRAGRLVATAAVR